MRVLRLGDLRTIPERHAVVVAGNAPPIVARLTRCLDGEDGRRLADELTAARAEVSRARSDVVDLGSRTSAALAYSCRHWLSPTPSDDVPPDDRPEVW